MAPDLIDRVKAKAPLHNPRRVLALVLFDYTPTEIRLMTENKFAYEVEVARRTIDMMSVERAERLVALAEFAERKGTPLKEIVHFGEVA